MLVADLTRDYLHTIAGATSLWVEVAPHLFSRTTFGAIWLLEVFK